ncbi:MAG: beta-galactosidase [Bacteroidota bacterium]|nr:beta-galactosidase [Bacteroidota bacterium]
MTRKLLLCISVFLLSLSCFAQEGRTISLAGEWKLKLDPKDEGIIHKWYFNSFSDKTKLPGDLATNGYGNLITVDTKWTGDIIDRSYYTSEKYAPYRKPGNIKMPFWLNPERYYLGAAWYEKEVEIPATWKKKHIQLFLERCHWETKIWVDGKEMGMQNSLGTPHIYDLSSVLTPGKHLLSICIDNRIKEVNVGVNSHSISDHTQGNWNGITGRIELQSTDPVYIAGIRIFPDIHTKTAKVEIRVLNQSGKKQTGKLNLSAENISGADKSTLTPVSFAFKKINKDTTLVINYPMGDNVLLWDEFQPNLYQFSVKLDGKSFHDGQSQQFGMREFKAQGTRLAVNGRPVFLRGTLECCIFPKTGYPPTDINEWLRIYKICKSFGLNHIRFHSYCPPEAAFIAADQIGMYLHVECSSWANQGSAVGDGKPIDQFLYAEGAQILKNYGNHPSFCMMTYGNEPDGKNMNRFLGDFVNHWKKIDSRRVYTAANGWPIIPESDYLSTPAPRLQGWGEGLNSVINGKTPNTIFDFRNIVSQYDRPMISHEIGEWCVYPNFKEIPKYTGNLKAKNFEIFRDDLKQNGMIALADDFLIASGKLQTLCYKADIEAALRTPGFAGFQLLDLHDFPGQGTALVGVLDSFWDEKGYVTGKEYSRFCNEVVPLARMEKRIFNNNENFKASIEISNFGPKEYKSITPSWKISDSKGNIFHSGNLQTCNIKWDNCQSVGEVELNLSAIKTAQKLNLSVTVEGYENDWDFWVYPSQNPTISNSSILVTDKLDAKAIALLNKGGNVLLSPRKGSIKAGKGGEVAVGFSSIFWNTAWTNKQPPHTLGILCDPQHPALAEFPTEFHSNWQWWDAMCHSNAILLSDLGNDLRPIVRIIDDWVTNRPLGLIIEVKVGKGKLIFTGIDLLSDADKRPEARQLLYSLTNYMNSNSFQPKDAVTPEQINAFFKE